MKQLNASLYSEFLKIIRSKILIGTIIALSLAPIMGSIFVIVLRNSSLTEGNSALQAKASITGFSPDWASFINLIGQAVGVGGIIVFGFISSWVFGREYSDHTVKDLLVLPVSRFIIVISKLIAVFIWSIFLVIFISVLALILGFLLKLPGWSFKIYCQSLLQITIITGQVILLCTPVTFIASVGKGYLAPLAFVILSVVLAQIIGALGYGAFFPWAIPAIYSKIVGTHTILTYMSYIILILTGLTGLICTIYWWKFADQTK